MFKKLSAEETAALWGAQRVPLDKDALSECISRREKLLRNAKRLDLRLASEFTGECLSRLQKKVAHALREAGHPDEANDFEQVAGVSDFYQLAPTILEALGQAAAEAKRVADAYHEKLVAADQATRESEHVVEEGKRIFNALRMSALEAPIAKERAEVLGGIAIGAHAAYFCARAYFLSDKPAQVVSMAGIMAAYGSGMVTGAEFSASRLAAERIVDPERDRRALADEVLRRS